MAETYKILSVGGSIIIPKEGFNIPFLKKFRSIILDRVKRGQKLVLVAGGGATCRQYQQAAAKITKLTPTDLDWIGIDATIINGQFLRRIFGEYAHKDLIINPTKKIKTNKPIIVAAGWQPGCSSDYDAVLHAKAHGAHHVLNLSNIDYIYDKDPNKYRDAKKIEDIDWKTFRKAIVGDVWEPGKNVPFDPTASKLAEKLKLHVSILKGTDLTELRRALDGKKFKGTYIHP